jgi:3-isopropylmalate/(R)-2-methylmalate dehydratase small subunit
MECPEAVDGIDEGDKISVDFSTGVITNETKGETYQSAAFPEFINEIIEQGGLLKSLKARLK